MENERPPMYTGYNRALKEKVENCEKYDKTRAPFVVRFFRVPTGKLKRQRAIDGYIVDFFCYSARLVIELDGSQHYTEEGEEYDGIRTEVLERYQLEVMRFWNSEVDRNFDYVCLAIEEKVRERTGSPF
ncbi:MAG: endonuclease domain-containing protein [Ruminococcus callidus]